MDDSVPSSSGVILTPINFTEFHRSIKDQLIDMPDEYTAVIDGHDYVVPDPPAMTDVMFDISTKKPSDRLMYPATEAGNRAYMEAGLSYKRDLKEIRTYLGKILKITVMSISDQSKSIMKAVGDYDKAIKNVAAFWRLIKESHTATSDREIFNSFINLVSYKQSHGFLTYLAEFTKRSDDVVKSIVDFDKMNAHQFMDVIKKVMLMTGVDQDEFKQVIDSVLDSKESLNFIDLQKRMTQFHINSQDKSLMPSNGLGYLGTGTSRSAPSPSKSPQVLAVCYDCKERFSWALSASSGLPFQRCPECQRTYNMNRNRKDEKVEKNMSKNEMIAKQDKLKKAAAEDAASKSENLKSKVKVPPKIIPAIKKVNNLPKSNKSISFSSNDSESKSDNFGVESDEESY